MDIKSSSKTLSAVVCTAQLAIATLFCGNAAAADVTVKPIPASQNLSDAFVNFAADDGVCSSDHVLSRVTYNFYHEVRHVPGLAQVRIAAMENPTLERIEKAPTFYSITRHYCSATAIMNDGSRHLAWYMVEDGQGFTGIAGMNVEFCVDGFDKWRIQDGSCLAIR